MNMGMLIYTLSRMLGIEGILFMVPALVAVYYQEECIESFLVTAVMLLVPALIWGRKRPRNTRIYLKDGYAIVTLTWVLWSLAGALPFWISGSIPSFTDALYETVSGFTTTGSTILSEIESLPRAILFWRSFTHWIGGMGVLVFVLAFLALTEKNTMYLIQAEMPGPSVDKVVPKIKNTAKYLYAIYFALTVLEILLLLAGGMDGFDSVIHAFGTAGTGGFSSKNNSIAFYESVYLEGVITVFMVLFGVNFNLFYLLLMRRFKEVLKNEELRAYLIILLGAVLLIAWNIRHFYETFGIGLRHAVFQAASIMTTTGYMTVDFDGWPLFSKYILLLLMVVGACAGSTGGGMKVSRILILGKTVKRELKQMVEPRSVNLVRLDGKRVPEEQLHGVILYFIAHVIFFLVSVLFLCLEEVSFGTAFTAVLTNLNTTGPGVEAVGPTMNFGGFSTLSKLVLCLNMLVGRLEVFPVLIFLSPSVWKIRAGRRDKCG